MCVRHLETFIQSFLLYLACCVWLMFVSLLPGVPPAPSNWPLDAEAGSYMQNPGTLTMPHGSSRTFPQGNEHTYCKKDIISRPTSIEDAPNNAVFLIRNENE